MSAEIYQQLWQQFQCALAQHQIVTDPYLDNLADDRRGITALAFLQPNSPAACSEVQVFQQQLAALEPAQYLQPASELHLTLLSIVSCISGFTLPQSDAAAYAIVFQRVLTELQQDIIERRIPPLQIELRGVTASPSCILLQGFAQGEGLNRLRDQLRQAYRQSGLYHSMDSRYRQQSAHLTLCRFTRPLQQPEAVLALCRQYQDYLFGHLPLQQIDLVFNNWYLQSHVTQTLASVRLDNPGSS